MGTLVGSRRLYLTFSFLCIVSVQLSITADHHQERPSVGITKETDSYYRISGPHDSRHKQLVRIVPSPLLLATMVHNANFLPLITNEENKFYSSKQDSETYAFSPCQQPDTPIGYCTSPAECLRAYFSEDEKSTNQYQTFMKKIFRIGVPHFSSSCLYMNSNGKLVRGVCCAASIDKLIGLINNEITEKIVQINGGTYEETRVPSEAGTKILLKTSNVAADSQSQIDRSHVFHSLHNIANNPSKTIDVSNSRLIWNKLPNIPSKSESTTIPPHTGLHDGHPPLPTHPPDHTNKPWWTSEGPISSSQTLTTKIPPTTKPWKQWMSTTTIKPTTTPPPENSEKDFCNSNFNKDPNFVDYDSLYTNSSQFIIGGGPLTPHSLPWMAIIYKGQKQVCGGSIIDKTHILTAAHCIASLSKRQIGQLRVVVGIHYIRTFEPSRQEFSIKSIVRHRGYSRYLLINDVAVLTLNRPIVITKEVRPICLYRGTDKFESQYGLVAGWGSLFAGGHQLDTPRKVSLRIWTNEDCKASYGADAPGGIVESYMCAGQQGRDACSGDSGGPIVKNIGGIWKQIGIVSWGIGCGRGNYPGVYSRMSSFLPWISDVVAKY